MKRRDLIRHLVDLGCELIREGGNHSWWGNPANGQRSAVPRHKEVSDVLARKICRDLGRRAVASTFGVRAKCLPLTESQYHRLMALRWPLEGP